MKRLALAIVAALALAGCGSSDDASGGGGGGGTAGDAPKASAPGITETTVTVGGHFPLTGPAAPGYSEIPRAIDAYFKHVNANGGVHGRTLKMLVRDDGYNPVNTVKVTKQLVLQDKVFGILGGLGTPTHTKVVDYLNSSRVPDIFVSSGCRCWDDPEKHPYTFGWQPDYVVEGKILGKHIAEHFKGKKVAYFVQNDDFGSDGAAGLDMYVPKEQVVARETYEPGNTDIGPQMAKIKASGAEVVASFSIPAYTALQLLAGVKLDFHPQMVVSNVGSDPITLTGLLKAFSKGAAGESLIDGIVTDNYLPPLGDTSNSWIQLFQKIHDQYIPKLPMDGNVGYGFAMAYTFVDALTKAGPNPTRKSFVETLEKGGLKGPGLVPFRYSAESHAGFTGVQIGTITEGIFEPEGKPFTTDNAAGEIVEHTEAPTEAPANGVPAVH